MMEPATSGTAHAPEYVDDDQAREELKRQVEVTRDAITQTVSEIGNVVMDQVDAVKETLDWREHVKKNPVAWSLGALGTGCLVGYVASSALKPDHHRNRNGHSIHVSAPQAEIPDLPARSTAARSAKTGPPTGPTIVDRLKHTAAYGRIREEAASVGNNFLGEVSNVAKEVLLPAAIGTLTQWLEKWVRTPDNKTAGNTGH